MTKESEKMRKKIIVLFMTMTMAVSLFTGCGENTDAVENKKNSTISQTTEESEDYSKYEENTAESETLAEGETPTDDGIEEKSTALQEENAETETSKTVNQTQGTQNTNTTDTTKNTNGGNSSNTSKNTNGGNSSNTSQNTADNRDNYKILGNYETLGSRYDKYKNAYKTGTTSGLSGDELTFYKNLKECLDQAKSKGTKVDKEKAVHDWIILHCKYDEENYYNDTIPWSSYNPEGVFINGTAVCNGYALAFQLCMDILGIESKIVVGTASYDYHAWNIVKMDDGCWYHVDVTWDDPLPDREGRIDYRYFNITDSYMRGYGAHKFSINETCNATKYSYWNYYESETLYVQNCEQLYKGIINWINSGKYTGRVAMEHRSADFDNFNNMYDYIRVYNATHKEVTYRFNMIYEVNGKTTYFPNGCAYAEFVVYDGSAKEDEDEEVIKYISSHDEFTKLIKDYSAANHAERILNIYLDPVLLASGDYSETFVKSIAVKALQFMNKEYVKGDKAYHISIAFDYNDETVISLDQVKAKIDELYSAGVYREYEINYYCGLSGDNNLTIVNGLKEYLSSKYNITGLGTMADPLLIQIDKNYSMDSTYRIFVTITGK